MSEAFPVKFNKNGRFINKAGDESPALTVKKLLVFEPWAGLSLVCELICPRMVS
jgi:hypothetical protein